MLHELEMQFYNLKNNYTVRELAQLLNMNVTSLWRQLNEMSALKFETIKKALDAKLIFIIPQVKIIREKIRFYD